MVRRRERFDFSDTSPSPLVDGWEIVRKCLEVSVSPRVGFRSTLRHDAFSSSRSSQPLRRA